MANEKIHEYTDYVSQPNLRKDRVIFDAEKLENGQWISAQCTQSDIFDVMMGSDEDSGLMIAQYTTAQIQSIPNPVEPNLVYNKTLHCLCFFDGTNWRKISHSAM